MIFDVGRHIGRYLRENSFIEHLLGKNECVFNYRADQKDGERDDLAKKLAEMELDLAKKNKELVEKDKEIAQTKIKCSREVMVKNEKIANQNKIIEDFDKREENLQLEKARRDFALTDMLTEKDEVLDEQIRENWELAEENKDLAEEIDESVEVAEGKDKLVQKFAQENLNLRRDFAEKDEVLDEVIRKNSELAQENQDLIEEIDESVEIAQEKDVVLNEVIRENWELAQENQDLVEKIDEAVEIAQEKDVVMDELIRKNWELAQVKVLEEVEDIVEEVEEITDNVEELEIELKFELKIAKEDEGHAHKALGPIASFFLPTGTEMFIDETILGQILVKNNLTSIGMAGKPKIIQPREDEERILCVEVTQDLALAIKACKEVLLDVPCLDSGCLTFKPITIYTQIFDLPYARRAYGI